MKPKNGKSSDEEPEWVQSFHASQDARESGDMKQAEALSMQTFAQILEEAGKQPKSPHLLELENAHQCEANADWDGAEAAFKRAVAAETAERGNAMQSLKSLARFYGFQNRDEEALEAIHAATEATRQFDKTGIFFLVALQAEISYLLRSDNFDAASTLFDEAMQMVEHNRHNDVLAHSFRLLSARFAIKRGGLDTAEAILDQMWPQIEKWRAAMSMAGYQSILESWWQIRALCCQQRGLVHAEIEALRQVVHFRRVIAQAPQLEGPYKFNALANALHKLGEALQRNGDALAAQVFTESASLQRSIGLEPLNQD